MTDRRNSKPKIFFKDEGKASLYEVLLEEHSNFDIYWFHWPYDGLFLVDDYEPITLIYKASRLCCLITRRAWDYQLYMPENGLITPPEILFVTTFHHPVAKTREGTEYFEAMKQSLIQEPYQPKPIKPKDISKKFRVGEGHPTNIMNLWMGLVEDPSVNATKIYNRYFRRN